MVHEHLDIQSILQEELKKERADRLLHVQQVHRKRRTWEQSDFNMSSEGETVLEADTLGPQQVESLLAFMVEYSTERALENAERDNIVYDALGEHRILGKHKKKKKSRPTTSY